MITYTTGNLFDAEVDVLVNPVNTAGVMGKGLALQFKRRYPAMFSEYRALCTDGRFSVGELWLYQGAEPWVLNFPTKKHWRSPSTPAIIEAGLQRFAQTEWPFESIAFPALGCGLGGLDFTSQVRPLMEKYLSEEPLDIRIYRWPTLGNAPNR